MATADRACAGMEAASGLLPASVEPQASGKRSSNVAARLNGNCALHKGVPLPVLPDLSTASVAAAAPYSPSGCASRSCTHQQPESSLGAQSRASSLKTLVSAEGDPEQRARLKPRAAQRLLMAQGLALGPLGRCRAGTALPGQTPSETSKSSQLAVCPPCCAPACQGPAARLSCCTAGCS